MSRKSNRRKLIWASYCGRTCSVNSIELLDTKGTHGREPQGTELCEFHWSQNYLFLSQLGLASIEVNGKAVRNSSRWLIMQCKIKHSQSDTFSITFWIRKHRPVPRRKIFMFPFISWKRSFLRYPEKTWRSCNYINSFYKTANASCMERNESMRQMQKIALFATSRAIYMLTNSCAKSRWIFSRIEELLIVCCCSSQVHGDKPLVFCRARHEETSSNRAFGKAANTS